MPDLIEAHNISKTFYMGPSVIEVVRNVSFSVRKGDFTAIMGPSGSGKTTLLNIIGCLDRPSEGKILFDGKDVSRASDTALSFIRATKIGFVFQTFFLIPHLNTYENVALPFLYSSYSQEEINNRTIDAIARVGLTHRLNHKPSALSGGEMQRAAIARALAIRPEVILADEPTGSLDAGTGAAILHLFKSLHDQGATIVMVTHDKEVANYAQTRLFFKDGKLH
ncbi:ABC transporter ATP-binding protein [Desulfobacterales bacterium HSG2]|nr:ABC transporter ATP-binding protein [Desulfobacterales bacterium HSG2]